MPQTIQEKNNEHLRQAGLESDLVADLIERIKRLEAARPSPQERLLSQEEAAVVIGVKPPTLAMWRHQGKGPRFLKLGRSCFYRPRDIETWLDEQCIVPIPKEADA
jgi:predicted DNA-binding transcriptional regulator AlpA